LLTKNTVLHQLRTQKTINSIAGPPNRLMLLAKRSTEPVASTGVQGITKRHPDQENSIMLREKGMKSTL
jgi:hypothetical protein